MPGPPPKPPDRRQRKERTGVGTLSLVEPGSITVPAAPRQPGKGGRSEPMLKVTRDAWGAFWRSHVATLIDEGDMPALRRLFLLYDERERMTRHVAEEGRLTTGSTGQLALDPIYKHLSVVDSQITALEDRFGLTPMARLKLGATFGAAAQSLDAMNARLSDEPDDLDDGVDPRLGAVPTTITRSTP